MRWTNCQSIRTFGLDFIDISLSICSHFRTWNWNGWKMIRCFPFWSFWVISYTTNLGTLRIIGPSYGGVWLSIGGFWDLQTISFEIPWFLGKVFFSSLSVSGSRVFSSVDGNESRGQVSTVDGGSTRNPAKPKAHRSLRLWRPAPKLGNFCF